MRNILDYFAILLGYAVLGIYLFIGGLLDIVIKTMALVISLPIITVLIIIFPFIKRIPNLRIVKKLYKCGGSWTSIEDYYFCSHLLYNLEIK